MNPFDKYNNQADVVSIDKWLAQQQALNKAKKNPQKKQSGNFLTHLIPTIGGTGGGVAGGVAGGALAGSAILPGVGTVAGGLLGALLGGTAGGAGGKVLENKVEGKSLGSGVAGQGIEQGVLSAGPLRLLKAASGGAKAAKAGISLTDALESAAVGNTNRSGGSVAKNLVTQGQQAQGRVMGISAGQTIAKKELAPKDTAKMLQVLKKEGIKTGNANNTFRDIDSKLEVYGKQIGDHFVANNTPFTKQQVNALAKEFVGSQKTTDKNVLEKVNTVANDLKLNVKDNKSFWEFRKKLDASIPDAKMATDEGLNNKTAAEKAMRRFITEKLGSVPGAKNYHSLAEVKPFVSAEARRANNLTGGITQRIAGSGPVQKAESALGRGAEKLGGALGGAPSVPNANPFSLGQVAKRTVPVGGLQAALGSLSEQNTNMANQQPSIEDIQNYDVSPDSGLLGGGVEQGGSPYTQDNLMADIQHDPKNADKYIQNFKDLQEIFSPSADQEKPKTQFQQERSDLITAMDNTDAAIAGGSINYGPIGSRVEGLKSIFNAADPETLAFKNTVSGLRAAITKARAGASLTEGELKMLKQYTPTDTDSEQVVRSKLAQLRNLYGYSAPTGGSSLEEALMSSGAYQ